MARCEGLTHQVYKETKDFPNEEKYGLVSQLRRVIISVTSNLAEGS
ncbi:four helix bundle protein [Gillisia sp. JM1]|nr:four helix bundle protein [Gillisia sp. JM1]